MLSIIHPQCDVYVEHLIIFCFLRAGFGFFLIFAIVILSIFQDAMLWTIGD